MCVSNEDTTSSGPPSSIESRQRVIETSNSRKRGASAPDQMGNPPQLIPGGKMEYHKCESGDQTRRDAVDLRAVRILLLALNTEKPGVVAKPAKPDKELPDRIIGSRADDGGVRTHARSNASCEIKTPLIKVPWIQKWACETHSRPISCGLNEAQIHSQQQ